LVLVIIGGIHLKWISPREYSDGRLLQAAARLLTSTEESSQDFQTTYGNTWSLAVEEWSYIFLSLLIPFLPSRHKWRFAAIMVPIFFLLLLKTYSVFRPHSLSWNWQRKIYLGVPPLNFNWQYGTPTNMWKIGVGVAARLLPWPNWVHRNKKLAKFLAPALIAVTIGQNYVVRPWIKSNGLRSSIVDPVVAFLTALTILASLDGTAFLEMPVLQFFGRISYSWYLWQWPLIHGQNWPSRWAALGVTTEAFGIAYFSTVYIEEPILKKFRSWREKSRNRELGLQALPLTGQQVT
jgi:peptidoglycan/LPS O-acetylase OafA/YrhL